MAEVVIETSARHVHLSKEHIEALFGKGAELTKKRELSQPGQFACEERVAVVAGESKARRHRKACGKSHNLRRFRSFSQLPQPDNSRP